jgi:4-carboxymuconolactone decarboxylase
MKHIPAILLAASLPLAAGAQSTITIARAGSQPSQAGPAERFTGSVRVDPLFGMTEPSGTSGASVTFEPRARTAWHSHPAGQTLIVTAGTGRVQSWGAPAEEIRVGDVVRIPPGVKHWHGASAGAAMTHIALTAAVDGKNADWMEHVSDEQYNAGSTAPSAQLQITQPNVAGRRMSPQDVQTVAPAFEKYTEGESVPATTNVMRTAKTRRRTKAV